jgi:hypothetical protein
MTAKQKLRKFIREELQSLIESENVFKIKIIPNQEKGTGYFYLLANTVKIAEYSEVKEQVPIWKNGQRVFKWKINRNLYYLPAISSVFGTEIRIGRRGDIDSETGLESKLSLADVIDTLNTLSRDKGLDIQFQ